MKPLDLSNTLSKYKKGWVALTPQSNEVIASASTLKEVRKKATNKGVSNPTVFRPVPTNKLYAG